MKSNILIFLQFKGCPQKESIKKQGCFLRRSPTRLGLLYHVQRKNPEVEGTEESGKKRRKEKEERQTDRLPIPIHPASRPACPIWQPLSTCGYLNLNFKLIQLSKIKYSAIPSL